MRRALACVGVLLVAAAQSTAGGCADERRVAELEEALRDARAKLSELRGAVASLLPQQTEVGGDGAQRAAGSRAPTVVRSSTTAPSSR